MEFFASVTDFAPIRGEGEKIVANCTSIVFLNTSSPEFDVNGLQVGYKMIINDLFVLYPTQAVTFGQNTGSADTTIYKISFKSVANTPVNATKEGVVGRINSVPPECIVKRK